MKETQNFEQISTEELKEWLLNVHEKYFVELKKANELPNSFWESYSSFCNTSGGFIILGVAESEPQNEIIGVGNPEKTITSLWDQLSNTNKVSYRNVDNQDVNTYIIDGKTIIIIYVKEAAEGMKPIYVGNKLENSWIRTGDGDRRATREELAAFMRNAQPGQDNLAADNFTIDDLDLDSVITYKERVSKRFPIFFLGGDSRPRNEIIMKLFRLLGVSERQGFGGPLIYKIAMQNDYRRPEILTNIERTELKVWNIDLVDSYPDLTSDEKSVLRYIMKSGQAQSVNTIINALNMTEYRVRNSIKTLEDDELIRKIGNGPSTKYTIGIESVEFLTQMQMVMDILKKQMV